MTRFALWLALAPAALAAGPPASWVPARWDGGPVEVARRAGDKALAEPAIRDALARWYDPATLDLLKGTPINCLLLTLSAGGDAQAEKSQAQLVKEYARRAHERGMAVLGLVYAGADADSVVAAAADAQLEGVILEGPQQDAAFARALEQRLRVRKSDALVIRLAPARQLRNHAGPIITVEGVSTGVGKSDDTAVASATAGVWIDSNMWLARSFQAASERPVWISHRPVAGSPGIYSRSLVDAAAAGARWLVTLDDEFRSGLLKGEPKSVAEWRTAMADLAWLEGREEWREFGPYGKVGIVLDTAEGASEDADEFLNLVGRRQVPYRVIERRNLDAAALAGLRAVLAFDPPTDGERKVLAAFAARGGLVLTGPAWGGAPKQQSYTILAEGEGEIAVYRERSPDPEAVARDLNDLVPTPDLGVSVFDAPSLLSYVSASADGRRILIRLVNYATAPSGPVHIWVTGQFRAARLEAPNQPPVELATRRSGGRSEITVPSIAVFGAVLVQ